MNPSPDTDAVMAGLKDFQRATVAHVMNRYFGSDPTRRFLVADETGLGKSVVARGVVSELTQRLQDDDSVRRIDIVYICSNQDVAKQNLSALNPFQEEGIQFSSRLTLLAKHVHKLQRPSTGDGKPVRLVAFTPGTSFEPGQRTGKAEERALIYLILEHHAGDRWDGWRRRTALRALQAGVASLDNFTAQVNALESELKENGGIDSRIAGTFLRSARTRGVLPEFSRLLDDVGRRVNLPAEMRERANTITGQLRRCLAQAGVDVLEPDLVIVDEFQRFRHLLDPESGPASELANELFTYPQARVLLLSATPYKAMTYAEEEFEGRDEHYRDLMATLGFLCDDARWQSRVKAAFAAYRRGLVTGEDTMAVRSEIRSLLLRVMSRTERPHEAQQRMLRTVQDSVADLRPADVAGFVALRHIAHAVDAPASAEYWKSAPYFINFTDGYQIGERLRSALKKGQSLDGQLSHAQLLDREALDRYRAVDLGNARLRRLAEDTVRRGWWKLLWVPPSLPYYALEGQYQAAREDGMTKRLVFSSWNATPSAIAGLLSYEAERNLARGQIDRRSDEQARRRLRARLRYRLRDDQPATMNQFMLFWPHPGLARVTDPLAVSRAEPHRELARDEVEARVRNVLAERVPSTLCSPAHGGPVRPWEAVARWGGGVPADLVIWDAVTSMAGEPSAETGDGAGAADDEPSVLQRHVQYLVDSSRETSSVAASFEQVAEHVAAVGLYAPGNVAWRALSRLIRPEDQISEVGHWYAAAVLASGLRSMFNRLEPTLLLLQQDAEADYWSAVLSQSARGCLQAVLDEYLHHVSGNQSRVGLDDQSLLELAKQAAKAIALRPSRHLAFDPRHPTEQISLPSRFALRYGSTETDVDSARPSEVRASFNSPFWPFVLATTSAGQEGIDFHWWCSAIVHWNVPVNPVDFEQREGRVHRFGGHAIRRNVASKHRAEALESPDSDVWKAAYDAARRCSDLGDFEPYWVYPGPAKIERHVLSFPLSRDEPRYRDVLRDLATYRLAFGQPRQEDLLSLLRHASDGSATTPRTIDLTPPAEADVGPMGA